MQIFIKKIIFNYKAKKYCLNLKIDDLSEIYDIIKGK